MTTRDEIVAGVEFVRSALEALDGEAADRDMTEDEQARWDEGVAFVRDGKAKIERIDARDAERAEIAEAIAEGRAKPAPEPFNVNTRTSDPFDLDAIPARGAARSAELRARAVDVAGEHVPSWVSDDARAEAVRKAELPSSRHYDADAVREHIVRTSSPEYLDAFQSYLSDPQSGPPQALRAAMSLTAANGGVLVPQMLDPTVVLTNAGTQNDVRRIAGQVSITVDQWDGVTSAGVTAEWLGEGTEVADATPTFVAPTITAHKAAAYVFGSYEVIADSGFDEVGMLIADGFDRLEASAFITGTGSSQPYGLITQLSGTGPVVAGSSGDAGAADFVAADVYALSENLGARWRPNASFLAAHATYNDIRQLGTSDTYHAFWTSFGAGTPSELIGYPTYHAEDMDSTIVSGSNDYILLLGDFQRGYKIVDRVGTSIAYNPLVIGSNQRPTGQAGWFAFKRVGADVITSNAFKLLKL